MRSARSRRAAHAEDDHANHVERSRWIALPLWCFTRLVLPVLLLSAIGAGVFYVRLLNGPISLKALAAPIARAIEAELGGFRVDVEDAAVLLTPSKGLEFHLQNVKFADPDGAPVALAPLAAVHLSTQALWRGQIAPERVVLIEPRMLMLYSREQGLALSFARTAKATPLRDSIAAPVGKHADAAANSGGAGVSGSGTIGTGSDANSTAAANAPAKLIDLGRTIALLASQKRSQATATSFLKRLGLRNATLIIDNAGQQAIWRVADAELGINQRKQGNVVDGKLSFATPVGRWGLTFEAHERRETGSIEMTAKLVDFVPRSIASMLPAFAPLGGLDFPVHGKAALALSKSGELIGATVDLDARQGLIRPGWNNAGTLPLQSGHLALRYQRARGLIEIAPSRLSSGASWLALKGRIAVPQSAGQPWRFDLGATEGMLGDQTLGLATRPLEGLRVRGSFDARGGALNVDEARIKVDGGEIVMNGVVPARGSLAKLALAGRMSPMSHSALLRLWPTIVAPSARLWSGRHIKGGRLVTGSFVVAQASGKDAGRVGADGMRLSVSLVGENVKVLPRSDLPPVIAPRALLRLEGDTLEVAAPDALVGSSGKRRIALKGLRMLAANVSEPTATGDLSFRALGPLQSALALLPKHTRAGRPVKLPGTSIEGRLEAQFNVTVPLGERLSADDLRLSGKGRVTDGKVRDVLGDYDINGATIAFDVTDQTLEAKGEMLFGGVGARVEFGRIFAADEANQPPLTVRATLDDSDRTQLKIAINDLVQGEVPIEIKVTADAAGEPAIAMAADLTKAELVIESLAWRKPSGRTASLQLDVKPGKTGTELRNFKVVGEDIAVGGSLTLDQRNRIVAFNFPDFSLHIVTRLKVQGSLKANNVWDVKVRGSTFDGRDFFQSLFSVGQVRTTALPASKTRAGIDLSVAVDNVIGYYDLSLKGLTMRMSRRAGGLVGLKATGKVVDGKSAAANGPVLDVQLSQAGGRAARHLIATTSDAGQVFRLVGFYPHMDGGTMKLDVNLEGRGAAEKTGLLQVRRFRILGDPVPYDGPGGDDASVPRRGARRAMQRPVLPFDSMRAPFSVGHGQFVIEDADLRGPVMGVVLKGKADFRARVVDLGGTYVPLQGLNSVVGGFPILGQLLAGPRGEGVLGMTFAIQGPMSRPQMLVNPVSFGLPGILREMMQMTNPSPRVTPRGGGPRRQGGGTAVRSSTRAVKTEPQSTVEPRIGSDGGWSSRTSKAPQWVPEGDR